MNKNADYIVFILILLISGCAKVPIRKPVYDYSQMNEITRKAHIRVEKFLRSCIQTKYPVDIHPVTRIDSVVVNEEKNHLNIYFNSFFAYPPFREKNTSLVYWKMRKTLGDKFEQYSFTIYADNQPIQQLIPNYYRKHPVFYDWSRIPEKKKRPKPVVRNISQPWKPTQGLNGKNIALWHSHGWYYEQKLDRWEWQRARLFQTVEDLGPMTFTLPYLVPMLEHAGATVFLPRERDIQTHEVIVDNDTSNHNSTYIEEMVNDTVQWQTGPGQGFAIGHPPYTQGDNPFKMGSYRFILTDTIESARIQYIPNIPETGPYAVRISYVKTDSAISDVRYTVYHQGGKTEFLVNQQIGSSTWIYLGTFTFKKGTHPDSGKVVLSNLSDEPGKIVTADAVRFGGGMGNIARNGKVSGRPRFEEGARYYLQYAGMPDTLVYNLHEGKDDYKDDYKCRGEWVNYLKGSPYGPNKNRDVPGLGIPIDLSLSFHTDAGITHSDTVVGTLLIYSTEGADSLMVFPDSVSRMANRDFADLLQTQIVQDIRSKYDPVWNRRDLWDKDYSEAFRPNVPAALLELLSHQNFLDVQFFMDPRFRFDVSRSIYKAMLRFLALQHQTEYVVQPLSVTHFQATFTGDREATLKWYPRLDSLEKTSVPKRYIVYSRKNDRDFDNGVLVNRPQMTISDLEPGAIYSFRVTAVNDGGESFPSETLAICWMDNGKDTVLIINGFDRVSGTGCIQADNFVGFTDFLDQGVPDYRNLHYTGSQFDFDPSSKWKDDDAPGHGASYGNFETKIIPGNTFDFPYVHGQSLRAAGHSFVSVSDEVIMEDIVDITQYTIVDLILGEEKTTDPPKPFAGRSFEAFPDSLQRAIRRFCDSGGNLILSGSYIGTDLFQNEFVDSADIEFATNTLRYFLRTNHAAKTGGIFSVDSTFSHFIDAFEFNTGYHPEIYTAEAPDAIEPSEFSGKTILRYSENNISAAVAFQGAYNVVALGFPFETILTQDSRNEVMCAMLAYLKQKRVSKKPIPLKIDKFNKN